MAEFTQKCFIYRATIWVNVCRFAYDGQNWMSKAIVLVLNEKGS